MSFILDALRKSDQQRQRASAPLTLATPAATPEPKAAALPVNALLAVVLLALGIVVGWLRPWQHEPAPAPTAVSVKPAAPAPSEAPARQPELAVVASPPLPRTMPVPAKAAAERPALVAPGTVVAPAAPPPPEPAAPVAPSPTGAGTDAMAISDLPPAIQQEMPSLSISLHAYAGKPRDRMVMINDKLLHQGDSFGSGLVLEQITPDGIIVSYKGYRFRRGVR